MSYDSDLDPDYSERSFPKTCFIHAWGWEVIESGPGRFRLVTAEGRSVAFFKTKDAAINYMNAEFL